MLVPSFGPTMNVIAYSPFHEGESANAVGGSDTANASDAAHKPVRLLRRCLVIGSLLPRYIYHEVSPAKHVLQGISSDKPTGAG
jgi:hypothetical protein